MLVSLDQCVEIFRCPRTNSKLHRADSHNLVFNASNNAEPQQYRIINGTPILIDFSNSAFSEQDVFAGSAQSPIPRQAYRGIKKFVKRLLSPEKASTRKNVARLISDLEKKGRPSRVLIVGGGSIGQGMEPIYEHSDIHVYGFDVYSSPHVQFVADAHHIPLVEDFFDAVIIQAVLEHVLQPAQVVSEIWRILRADGLVYAETPFMQQVHEGAFDFTRFTESGHRYLFRDFELVSSGASAGPGTQFMWSVDYLVRGLFRSARAGKLAKLAFFWAQYLDRWIPPSYAEDGASGVFFYGRKSQIPKMPREIVMHYRGAQK